MKVKIICCDGTLQLIGDVSRIMEMDNDIICREKNNLYEWILPKEELKTLEVIP